MREDRMLVLVSMALAAHVQRAFDVRGTHPLAFL
jgi:hypothetical protein